jgi:hypothetical protein
MILAECSKVYLVWVSEHTGIDGKDQLAKIGSVHQFIGPESICSISGRVAGQTIVDWIAREHQKHWQFIPVQRHAKGFLNECSVK